MKDMPFTPLGEIASVVRGVTFSKADATDQPADGLLPVLRAGNIQDSLVLDDDLVYVPRGKISDKQMLRQGDIVICTSSGSSEVVGKTGFARNDWPGSFGAFCAGIRAKPTKSDPSFLFYYLRSPAFRSWTQKSAGANIKNIRKSELDRFEVPVPSLPEQRRIAAILDKADEIRRKREQVLVSMTELLQSAFLEKFGDPITNSRNLPRVPIKELGRVVTGNTPSRKNAKNFGDEIEWIKSDNINTPDHFLTKAEEYLSDSGKLLGRLAPAGSTLVTCIAGSPSVIGNAAISDREVAFNQQINAVIPNDTVNPYFLYTQFLVSKNLIQLNSTNSMKGMVSKGKFQEIKFLRPSEEEQEKFGELFIQINAMTARLRDSYAESEKLFGSLSVRAFRGEL